MFLFIDKYIYNETELLEALSIDVKEIGKKYLGKIIKLDSSIFYKLECEIKDMMYSKYGILELSYKIKPIMNRGKLILQFMFDKELFETNVYRESLKCY